MKPNTALEPSQVPASPSRWRRWLFVSLIIQILTFLFYPACICGCHFHLVAVPVGLIPVGWAAYTFARYRGRGERAISYANVALAIGWLYLAWDSNLMFAFR